jgi:HAD superfamily hydrolase (TIGR01509 family)
MMKPLRDEVVARACSVGQTSSTPAQVKLHATSTIAPQDLSEIAGCAVVFDVENVFYDATSWRRWLFRLITRMGVFSHYRPFFRVWDRDFLVDVQRGRKDYWDAFREFLQAIGMRSAQIDEVLAAATMQYLHGERDIRLLPDVRSTISQLRSRGLSLGVLANSHYPSAQLTRKLERLGVRSYLQSVVCSLDVRDVMPSPECYETALDGLGQTAEKTVFVAADTAALTGAAAVGMNTVAFNHDPDATADIYLDRFSQLLALTAA